AWQRPYVFLVSCTFCVFVVAACVFVVAAPGGFGLGAPGGFGLGAPGGFGLGAPPAFGAKMAIKFGPSILGRASTALISASSSTSRSRRARPMLWWTISRPLKKTVALTLSPCFRNRMM